MKKERERARVIQSESNKNQRSIIVVYIYERMTVSSNESQNINISKWGFSGDSVRMKRTNVKKKTYMYKKSGKRKEVNSPPL